MKIFITGVSGGIGRELTRQLMKGGHTVWGVARRERLLKTLKNEVDSKQFFYSVCDVGQESNIDKTFHAMKKKGFFPDVVVLNAAVFFEDAIPQYNHKLLLDTFDINLFGALSWVEKFLQQFLLQKSGHFIAISSTSAFRPNTQSVALSSSKAALAMAFRVLRIRYVNDNIIFSTIHFGPVATSIEPHYVSQTGEPKYPFVLTISEAARHVQNVIKDRKAKNYFFPFFTTLLFRLTLFIPDSFFAVVSRFLKKTDK